MNQRPYKRGALIITDLKPLDLNKLKEEPKKKRGRGRPPKKPPKVPKFKNKTEVREYLLKRGLELNLLLVETAKKKNNIKNPQIANAKTRQHQTALKSLETINSILKDSQIDDIEQKLNNFELGLFDNSILTDENILIEFDKLKDDYLKVKDGK